MKRRLAAPLLLAVALCGCRMGPDYRRPGLDAPAQHRNQIAAEQASLADLPWWEIFKDPALEGLVTASLTNNYDLRIAVARIDQSREIASQARSLYFPYFDYGANIGGTKPAIIGFPVTIPSQSLLQGFLSMSWELDVWGRIRRTNEAALAELLASEESRRGILLTLVSDVAQSYYELLGLDLQLEIAKKNVASFQRSFDIFEQRLEGGVASKLESARAEAALATVAAFIPEIERQIAIKENQINVLLGQNPGPVARRESILSKDLLPGVPAGLPSALIERRPDIRQSEALLRSANARIGIATANFFPQIGLTAVLGRQSAPLENITNGGATYWNALATMAGPIFQAGNLKARKREAIAFQRASELRYRQTALTAFREVSDALVSREKLEQVRVQLDRAVKAYEVSVDIATQRYRAGLASYLEIVTAQQELFPAERDLAQTQINQRVVLVQLYKALGGGWNIQDPAWLDRASLMPPKP